MKIEKLIDADIFIEALRSSEYNMQVELYRVNDAKADTELRSTIAALAAIIEAVEKSTIEVYDDE